MIIWNKPPYLAGISTTGAGATCGSGCDPQDALSTRPAAAARMIVIFIAGVILRDLQSLHQVRNYLAASTGAGAGAACWHEQEALNINPAAAAAIAIILTIFIL